MNKLYFLLTWHTIVLITKQFGCDRIKKNISKRILTLDSFFIRYEYDPKVEGDEYDVAA